MDAVAEPQLLKVVGSPRRIGAKVTLYEVAPGDTVTLTESVPVELSGIVVRGATSLSAPTAQNAREKSATAPSTAPTPVAAASPPESRVAVGAGAGVATAPSSIMANAIHTITWTDATTGNMLSLTGRMPEARLQEIRVRIEGERAAAAKKNP
jgi:mRNA-degrading endonuclease toxin of MazEF toxin-antitoxin module